MGAALRARALAKEQSVAAQQSANVSAVAQTARRPISVLPAHCLSLPEADPWEQPAPPKTTIVHALQKAVCKTV